jgi:cystathionine beta-lyase
MAANNKIDFDVVVPRQGTGSRKWDAVAAVFGADDVLPLWIADMDFSSPSAVTECLRKRTEHSIFAYNTQEESLFTSFIDWCRRRYGWDVKREWILVAPGVVPSIILSILALTEPGDGVIIQPPVYPPFFSSIRDNGRTVVENPLLNRAGRYEMDFVDLEAKLADPQNKLLLLCSPHNPVGRVWSRAELQRLYELCQQYGVDVLADEIHNDLVYSGHKHTVFASLGQPVCKESVTFMAASKTFNIAGLNSSFIIAPCKRRREQIFSWLNRLHMTRNNLFGVLAVEAAYSKGEAWLDELLPYLEKNADRLVQFIHERLPKLKVYKPEGTYLVWLDFRAYFATSQELDVFLIKQAKVGLNSGKNFGSPGEGFARLNLATQQSVLLEALTRIEKALKLIETT